MSDDRKGLNAVAPWGAVIVATVAAVYGYGVQSSRIDSLEDQVREMRAEARGNAITLVEIQKTTAAIDARLQWILPTGPTKEARH